MLIWFSKNVDLYAQLDAWRNAGSNYEPDQAVDNRWSVDGLEAEIGSADDPQAFERAVDQLFAYDVYPASVMQTAADFIREQRPPRTGDRIIQRIHVLPGILDALVMNIVSAVWHENDRRGFTVITSEYQYLSGEWTASISRKRSGALTFMLHAISLPAPRLPSLAHGVARRLQTAGFKKAAAHFKKTL